MPEKKVIPQMDSRETSDYLSDLDKPIRMKKEKISSFELDELFKEQNLFNSELNEQIEDDQNQK